MKKGQILLGFLGIILIFFSFLVIIVLNYLSFSYNLSFIFQRNISLKSLEISGLRYALYRINQDRDFTTTSMQINLPQGYVDISITTTSLSSNLRLISLTSTLTSTAISKNLFATATIDISSASSTILNLEVSD